MQKLRYWIVARRDGRGNVISLNVHHNFPLSKGLQTQLRELPFVREITLVTLVKEQITVLTHAYAAGTTLDDEITQASALLNEYLEVKELDLSFSNH